MTKREILIMRILEASRSKDWEMAKKEWYLDNIWFDKSGSECLCTHDPIVEICAIRNRYTQEEREVGNCCVKNFLGLASNTIFNNLKRIVADDEKALMDDLIQMAKSKGWIDDWEYGFCMSTKNKRFLTTKQLEQRKRINGKILRQIARTR